MGAFSRFAIITTSASFQMEGKVRELIQEDNESINDSIRRKFQSGIAHTASSQSLSIFVDVDVLDNFPSTYRQLAADR